MSERTACVRDTLGPPCSDAQRSRISDSSSGLCAYSKAARIRKFSWPLVI
jgi:hypothetical protein